MLTVTFVAPFFLETTLRFVNAVADLPGIQFCLLSQDPLDKLPAATRAKLSAHRQLANALDAGQIADGVRALAAELGVAQMDRLLGTLEELQVPLGEVREQLGIRGMDAEEGDNFRDKARMKSILAAAGLPCARHQLVANQAEAAAFAQRIGFPLVVKPPAGSGARSTYRVNTDTELAEAIDVTRPSADNPVLLEEFITGQEHSFDSVCIGGQMVWHSISRYFPTPLEVLQNPWIQWVVMLPREIDVPEFAEIRRVAPQVLKTLGMVTGMSHMEWFRRKDGTVAVSEVGARPPGAQFTTLISYAHDFDMYKAWARLLVFEEFTPPRRDYACGIVFLRGQGTGRVAKLHGLEDAQRELAPLVVEAKLPKAGQRPSGTYEGEGYVIVRHPETAVVEKALARLVSTLRVELRDDD